LSTHVAQLSDYVAAMNLRAQSLGLTHTTFVNPIGLDDRGHLSTARDIITLGKTALLDETLRRIVATPSITIQGKVLENTNELLGTTNGVFGIKTGYTEEAGECLLFVVRRDEHTILGVILGSEDRFGDARNLIEWAFNTHAWSTEL
jgi:serine-type D-Ala-D-Ala carboxypeptidase (penicillin-binding protein 5/6)